ncbi:ninja-family protein AFP3-like [Solanum verrucosum]|uniref:ninja-family protein AFP3-like n=1 Tax=Solanum verrucosum TaxID=315347 RepID=UPI0020D1410E|nr:ninja-family protein AFP3-like [Solanum verrucosum]
MGTSNVENENVELNGGSQGSVASSVVEVETQQPPTQVLDVKSSFVEQKSPVYSGNYIAKGKIKIFMLNHMTFVFTRGEGPNGKKIEGLLYSCKNKDEAEKVGLCHGDLLNAVEFVEHTDGGYVEHPLNYIFIDGKYIKKHCY